MSHITTAIHTCPKSIKGLLSPLINLKPSNKPHFPCKKNTHIYLNTYLSIFFSYTNFQIKQQPTFYIVLYTHMIHERQQKCNSVCLDLGFYIIQVKIKSLSPASISQLQESQLCLYTHNHRYR